MKSLPSGPSSMADTQALWRFLNNPRVKPVDLSSPLLAMAREGLAQDCQDYALAVHDWSRLNFRTHDSEARSRVHDAQARCGLRTAKHGAGE